jgi:hypothetical protein
MFFPIPIWPFEDHHLQNFRKLSCKSDQWGNTFLHVSILEKILFSRTSQPISIKLGTYHICIKEIEDCTNKGQGPLQRGDNCKNDLVWSKIFFLMNHKVKKALWPLPTWSGTMICTILNLHHIKKLYMYR